MAPLPVLARAAAHGGRVALECGPARHTYDELLGRAGHVAAAVLAGGRDLAEARVAFLVPPGPEYVATLWGIWQAGGIALPLSLSATAHELDHVLDDAAPTAVVAAADAAVGLADACRRRGIRLVEPPASSPGGAAPGQAVAPPDVAEERPALILYTSGTTSRPKGVVTTHRCLRAQIESLVEAWRWRPEDRIPLFLPLHHVHGIVNVLCCGLWSGATVDMFPRFDADAILPRVAADAYTLFMAVPTIYVRLIEALDRLPAARRTEVADGFRRMRLMVSGSAALPASVFARWEELTGQRLLERYGMTEIGMALSNPYDGERRPGAVGGPLPGVEVRLVGEDGRTVDRDGEPGEIQVRGPNVFLGYWNRPDATRESFQDGWFRSGDVAVVERGSYRILGRSSLDIIKSGGYKLSALEIEAALLDHPAIGECAVVGLPDATWGEAVAAAVVLREGRSLDAEGLRDWCRGRISPYKIPRVLRVVDALPRNAMGKVTKPAVVAAFARPDG